MDEGESKKGWLLSEELQSRASKNEPPNRQEPIYIPDNVTGVDPNRSQLQKQMLERLAKEVEVIREKAEKGVATEKEIEAGLKTQGEIRKIMGG